MDLFIYGFMDLWIIYYILYIIYHIILYKVYPSRRAARNLRGGGHTRNLPWLTSWHQTWGVSPRVPIWWQGNQVSPGGRTRPLTDGP